MDKINTEYLKSLVGNVLSLLKLSLEWQTKVVVYWKSGAREFCSNYSGIGLLSLHGKVYIREQISASSWTPDSTVTMWFSPWLWNTSVSWNLPWYPDVGEYGVSTNMSFHGPVQFQGVERDQLASILGTPGVHLDVFLVSSGSSEFIGVASSLVNNLIGYWRFSLTHTHGIIIFAIDLFISLYVRHTGSDQERPCFWHKLGKLDPDS